MATQSLIVTVDATNPLLPKLAIDAAANSVTSQLWASQNKAQLLSVLSQVKSNFYATHTAADHPRQRQKLATALRAQLLASFAGQDFSVATASGIVSASAVGS